MSLLPKFFRLNDIPLRLGERVVQAVKKSTPPRDFTKGEWLPEGIFDEVRKERKERKEPRFKAGTFYHGAPPVPGDYMALHPTGLQPWRRAWNGQWWSQALMPETPHEHAFRRRHKAATADYTWSPMEDIE